MVKVCLDKFPDGYYMDGYIQGNLDIAKKVIHKDWDMIFVVDGYEGTGKSVLTQQMAFYCDPSLTIDRITFNPKDFRKQVLSAEKYQAVVYDEAYGGLSARAYYTEVNRTLVEMLAEIRQKNLFIFIVLPCFFELDKYVALWRSRALFHVYTQDNFKRGSCSFYDQDRKKSLYTNGKRFLNYYRPSPNFIASFVNFYVVNEDDYREKKASSIKTKSGEKVSRARLQRDALVKALYYDFNLTQQKIVEYMEKYCSEPIEQQAISLILNKTEEKEEEMMVIP